jgi:hypothetical protein
MMRSRIAVVLIGMFATTSMSVFAYLQDKIPTSHTFNRIYKTGDSQNYTFKFEYKSVDDDETFKAEGELIHKVSKLLSEGKAETSIEFTKAKMSFMEEEFDALEYFENKSWECGKSGMPLRYDEEDLDSAGLSFWLSQFSANQKVDIGKTYEIKFVSDDKQLSVDGQGTLVATGRLYEERVAKVEVKVRAKTDEFEATYNFTTYLNLETGKLVKSEGNVESKEADGNYEIKFIYAKVRK